MSISLILLLVVTLVRLAIFAFVIYAAVQGVKALRKYNRSGEVRKEKAETRRSLGEVLKEHRVRCKMTQEFVAESLGVSRQAVSKWETGTADPSTSNLLALAKLFGVSAEELLRQGRVRVNGQPAALGDQADPESDTVTVDGQPLRRDTRRVYLMLNKPRGYVTTLSDERGRRTAAELVSGCGARVYPVGRLDMDSEGLLLMTNDGAWMQRLLHPSHQIEKEYRVTVTGPVEGAAQRLAAIRDLEGERIRPARVRELWRDGSKAALSVTIHEGKNRQIRRMCRQAGLAVQRLQRVREHTLTLGDLPAGQWRYLTQQELRDLEGSEKS